MTARRVIGAPGFDRFWVGAARMSTADFLAAINALNPTYLYCADVGVTVTGSGVSTWLDQSGNGHTGTQATDAKRPPLNATDASFNDRASADFNGGQCLTCALSGGWGAGTNHHVFAVWYQDTPTTGTTAFMMDNQSGRLAWSTWQTPGNVGAYHGAYMSLGPVVVGRQTLEWEVDDPGNLVSGYRSGVFFGSAAFTLSKTLGGAVAIGSAYTGTTLYMEGRLACLVGWSGAALLSAPNVAAVRAAIKSYYGSGVMT